MLRETDVFDAQGFAFADLGEPKAPALVSVEDGAHGAAATIPDAHLLFNSEFTRAGNDLHLNGHDGERAIVRDYFASEERAALMSREGARLSPDLVEALTKSIAPQQYAQAGAPAPAANDAVGRVVTASADSTILRNGVPVTLRPGDAVLRADVLQTAGGTMAVTFNDGSTLNLTANTRIVVSEFIYSPNGTGNSQLLDLVQGSLTFISGEVAHSGNMSIGTPVATMGIRGTVGGVTTASDGTVQFYVSQSATGAVIINAQGQIIANVVQDGPLIVVRPVGPLQVVAEEIGKTPQQLALELQALQQIVSIKAIGDQILQQFLQPQQQSPNPQSGNGPHTQIQVDDKLKITLISNGDANGDGTNTSITHAVLQTVTNDDDTLTPVTVPIPVNLPPVTFAPLTATTKEDTALVFSGGRAITIADIDSPILTVTLSVTNGVLSLGSVSGLSFTAGDGVSDGAMTFSGSLAAIASALSGLTFTPAQDYNGAAVLSITKTDGVAAATTTTVDINVTAVNDAPVLNYFNVNVSEGDEVVLSPDDYSVTDPDGPELTFTVTNVTGGEFVVDNGNSNLFLFQTFESGQSVTFTAADIAAGRVRFIHDGSENAPGFSISVSDGEASSNPVVLEGEITQHVNDAPEISAPEAISVDEGSSIALTGQGEQVVSVSDSDTSMLSVTLSVSHGVLNLDLGSEPDIDITAGDQGEATITFTATQAVINDVLDGLTYTPDADYHGADTLQIQVSDGTSTSTETVGITVNSMNDVPELSLIGHVEDQFGSQAYNLNSGIANWATDWIENENGHYSSSPTTGEIQVRNDPSTSNGDFRLFLSDDDSESGVADTIQRTANLSGATSATLSFDYRRQISAGDSSDVVNIWASSDGTNFTLVGQIGATGDGSFVDNAYQQFSVNISSYISSTTTIRFSIDDAVDDGDWFFIDNVRIGYSATPTFVEDGPGVSIAPVGAFIKDLDDTTLQSATITITNAQNGDILSASGQLPAGIVASSYNAGTGVLTLTGSATLADYQAALAQIQFSNTGDNPGSADRTITVTVSDGTTNSNTSTVTVHVTPVNDAPENVFAGAGMLGHTVGYTYHYPTVADAFSNSDTNVTVGNGVELQYLWPNPNAWASVDFTDTQIIFDYFASTTWPIQPFNGVEISDRLNQLSDILDVHVNPVSNMAGLTDANITFDADHIFLNWGGLAFDSSTLVVLDITFAGAASETLSVAEDTELSITGLSVKDVDAGSSTLTTTLSVAHGILTLASAGGAAVAGSGTATVTLTGTLAQINTTLAASNNVVYRAEQDYNGSDTLTVMTNDGGASGGGAQSDTDTVAISVTAVNDAPEAAGDVLSSVVEDSGVRVISIASLLGNDSKGPADESGQDLTLTDVSNVVGGTAVVNGTNIEFTPAANFNGTASFDYTVQDNGQTNGADDFKSDTGSVSFAVTAVNDAPSITSVTPTSSNLAFTISDVDNSTFRIVGDFGSSYPQDLGANASITPAEWSRFGTLRISDQAGGEADVIGLALAGGGNDTNLTAPLANAPNAIYGFGGDDRMTGGTAADYLFGGDGTDTLVGAQNDIILDGGARTNDTLEIGANFTSTSDGQIVNIENVTLTAAVTLNLGNQTEGFTITGSDNADTLTGGSGADTITGGDGNDTISGGAGVDHLTGGAGSDTFVVASASDFADDVIDGTAGSGTTDVIKLTVGGTYDMSTATISNIDNIVLTDAAGGYSVIVNDNLVASAHYNGASTGWLHFGSGGSTVAGDVTIDASSLTGTNSIFINGGGFTGTNTYAGGHGDDLISSGGTDTFVFHGNFGNDTIQSFTAGNAAGHDVLQFDSDVFASAQDVLNAMSGTTNTVITYDGSNTVTLSGVDHNTLTAANIQIYDVVNHVIIS